MTNTTPPPVTVASLSDIESALNELAVKEEQEIDITEMRNLLLELKNFLGGVKTILSQFETSIQQIKDSLPEEE